MRRSILARRIDFADCEPGRMIRHPRLFEMFDRGTEALFGSVGFSWRERYGRDGFSGMVLVEASAEMLRPLGFGDMVEIESRIEDWRTKAFVLRHLVRKDGVIAVDGREVRVWTLLDPDRPGGIRAAPVPARIRALFEA